jgi:hypothetical protein
LAEYVQPFEGINLQISVSPHMWIHRDTCPFQEFKGKAGLFMQEKLSLEDRTNIANTAPRELTHFMLCDMLLL